MKISSRYGFVLLLWVCSTPSFLCGRTASAQVAPKFPVVIPRVAAQAPVAAQEIVVQARAARAILDGGQAQNPVRGERVLRIVYWTPGDREPAPRYQERLSKIMLDIQEFYGREMERNGFGRRTFKLENEAGGLVHMTVARGDKPRTAYSGDTGMKFAPILSRRLKRSEWMVTKKPC